MFSRKNTIIIALMAFMLIGSAALFAGDVIFIEDNDRTTGHVWGDVWIYNLQFGTWSPGYGDVWVDIYGPLGHTYRYEFAYGSYDANFVGDPIAMAGDQVKVTFWGYNSGWIEWDYDEGACIDIWYNPSE